MSRGRCSSSSAADYEGIGFREADDQIRKLLDRHREIKAGTGGPDTNMDLTIATIVEQRSRSGTYLDPRAH